MSVNATFHLQSVGDISRKNSRRIIRIKMRLQTGQSDAVFVGLRSFFYVTI